MSKYLSEIDKNNKIINNNKLIKKYQSFTETAAFFSILTRLSQFGTSP